MKLAVAGGHSKATAVAFTGSPNTTWRVLACSSIDEGLNLHSRDAREIGRRFKRLIEQLAKRLGYSEGLFNAFEDLNLVLPGAATKEDQKLADAALIRAGWRSESVTIVDDTWAGLIAGASSDKGICAFAGTGASVFVGLGSFQLDRVHKIDGWGPFLGDRGSGFQLAMRTLRRIARSADRGQASGLAQAFFEATPDISESSQLQEWFDQRVYDNPYDWNIEVAKIAKITVQRADDEIKPDEEARALVDDASEHMSMGIITAVERFGPDTDGLPVVFQGGMFEHSKRYRTRVAGFVTSRVSNPLKMSHGRPLYGAMLLGMLQGLQGVSAELIQENESRIEPIPPDFMPYLYY